MRYKDLIPDDIPLKQLQHTIIGGVGPRQIANGKITTPASVTRCLRALDQHHKQLVN